MSQINVKIVNKSKHKLPQYETSGASGMDIRANLETSSISIAPGQTVLVPTGVFVEIPDGYEIQVRPRSGLSLKTKLRVANSPGTIDSCYRGEIKVIMTNTADAVHNYPIGIQHVSYENEVINDGDRIAQIVLCEVPKINWVYATELSDTDRGTGGFGSTGK